MNQLDLFVVDPLPEEIEAEKRAIREGWDEATHRERAGLPSWRVPQVAAACQEPKEE